MVMIETETEEDLSDAIGASFSLSSEGTEICVGFPSDPAARQAAEDALQPAQGGFWPVEVLKNMGATVQYDYDDSDPQFHGLATGIMTGFSVQLPRDWDHIEDVLTVFERYRTAFEKRLARYPEPIADPAIGP